MRRRTAFVMMSMTCFLVLFIALYALADDWVLLGSRTVALVTREDSVSVTSSQGMFNAIQLQIKDSGVQFTSLQIVFGNGEILDVPIRNFIPAGGHTRVIDLPNSPRYINKVIFYYETSPGSSDKATVELWGLRD